ncbi:hypothetical protein D9M68_619490 [compost metagenome]
MYRRPALGQGVGSIISLGPFTARGEGRPLVIEAGALAEYGQRYLLHRGGAELGQVCGQGIHAGETRRIVVRPEQHITPDQRGEVGLLPGVGAVRPAGGNVGGQQLAGRVGGLLALAEHHRRIRAGGQLIEAQQWARLGQALPAPLLDAVAAVHAPRQRGEHLARHALFILPEVEAIEHH